jgi:hypothetical protein
MVHFQSLPVPEQRICRPPRVKNVRILRQQLREHLDRGIGTLKPLVSKLQTVTIFFLPILLCSRFVLRLDSTRLCLARPRSCRGADFAWQTLPLSTRVGRKAERTSVAAVLAP